MSEKTSTATLCQLANNGRLMDRFEIVESYGPDAPRIGTRLTYPELISDYPKANFSINTAVFIDYSTGKRIN